MYVRVGEAIRAARHEACVGQAELAHMQKIESGETACALHVLVSIADEFDTTLDALVPVAIDEKELVA
jgi:hypothetical protein